MTNFILLFIDDKTEAQRKHIAGLVGTVINSD